jgi:hypothetical protein
MIWDVVARVNFRTHLLGPGASERHAQICGRMAARIPPWGERFPLRLPACLCPCAVGVGCGRFPDRVHPILGVRNGFSLKNWAA